MDLRNTFIISWGFTAELLGFIAEPQHWNDLVGKILCARPVEFRIFTHRNAISHRNGPDSFDWIYMHYLCLTPKSFFLFSWWKVFPRHPEWLEMHRHYYRLESLCNPLKSHTFLFLKAWRARYPLQEAWNSVKFRLVCFSLWSSSFAKVPALKNNCNKAQAHRSILMAIMIK